MIVGLTGGIGSGKSTVAKMFENLKIPVYITDDRAKKLTETSLTIKEKIVALLGEMAYKDKKPDRLYIAQKVFNNRELLQELNSIIHPEVQKDFDAWIKQQKSPYVIKEAAILFETGSNKHCDVVIMVTAPVDVRIERVMNRDGVKREDVLARIKNQWDDQKKIALSDYVIENTDLEKTSEKVLIIHNELSKKKLSI